MSKKVAPATAFPQGPGNGCQSMCGGELTKAVKVGDFIDSRMLLLPIYDSTNLNEKSFSGNSVDYLGNICNCVDLNSLIDTLRKIMTFSTYMMSLVACCLTKYLRERDLR